MQDRSVIDHLAKSFSSRSSMPGRKLDSDSTLCEQFRKQWTGGLPQF